MMAPVHLAFSCRVLRKLSRCYCRRYYHGHLDRIDDGPSPLPDVNKAKMLALLAITVEMEHCLRGIPTDYCATTNQFHPRFYSSATKRDRYLHFLRFLHFTDSSNEPDMTDENSDRLWKMWNLFEILNKTFSKFYSSSEYLAIKEGIVLFKGRVIFRQYIPKKHKRFGIKTLQTMWHTRMIWQFILTWLGWGNFTQRCSIHPRQRYTGNDGASL